MDRRFENASREVRPLVTREVRWWTWQRVFLATVVVLVLLEVGTYTLNWTWTGFKDNDTVWDWLQLLILPIALAAVPIWMGTEEKQQRLWLEQLKWVLVLPFLYNKSPAQQTPGPSRCPPPPGKKKITQNKKHSNATTPK